MREGHRARRPGLPGHAVETHGKIEFIVLSESASSQSTTACPRACTRWRKELAEPAGRSQTKGASDKWFRPIQDRPDHRVREPCTNRSARRPQEPGQAFPHLTGAPRQSAELKQDAAEKGHPAESLVVRGPAKLDRIPSLSELPAAEAGFVHVGEEGGSPATRPFAVHQVGRASACCGSARKAPLPSLTPSTNSSRPAASFWKGWRR